MIRTFAIAVAALAASACHSGADAEERDAGSSVSRTYQVGAFDKIVVAGSYDVTVTTGGAPGVSATGGEKLLDQTEVVVENGTLKIMPKKNERWRWGKRDKAQFTVTTAMLHGAVIAGSGEITINRVEGDFQGKVAGSGELHLAAVDGGVIDLTIAGSGKVGAAGKARSTKIVIAGSGNVDASGLVAETTDVAIAGSGNVNASASDSGKIQIKGSGNVAISGGAKCEISKAGSGNVTCG